MGEPAGIGPDVLLHACQRQWPEQLLTIGDADFLAQRARSLGLPLQLVDAGEAGRLHQPGTLALIPLSLNKRVIAGELNPANAGWVLKTLEIAGRGCLDGQFSAVCTAPVHKGVINDAGVAFSGHTEFFADLAGTQTVVMMLATTQLRVALVTTHLPLRDVPDAITAPRLKQILDILVAELALKFGIARPRILVCGLNPHAGEGGHLGMEEIEIISPVMAAYDASLAELVGPLPADTLFTPPILKGADAVLAMYHDQGLPVLKSQGFGEAVNITLGLPFVRTSVDHGTALSLAATGRADSSSLCAAIEMAIHLGRRA